MGIQIAGSFGTNLQIVALTSTLCDFYTKSYICRPKISAVILQHLTFLISKFIKHIYLCVCLFRLSVSTVIFLIYVHITCTHMYVHMGVLNSRGLGMIAQIYFYSMSIKRTYHYVIEFN